MKRHVVLVGLPGSGKTTVGRLVAEALHADFVDIDAILARREGKSIMLIFAEHGEAVFREMEHKEMAAALANPPAVLAPGGGWAAQPGELDGARPQALVVYLKIDARTAAARAAPEGTRPLLMGEDPVARMQALLADREPYYGKADAQVETEKKTVQQVVSDVTALARSQAGW